jgi:hypothetical protein
MYLPLQGNYRPVQPVSIAGRAENIDHPSDSESSDSLNFKIWR